MFHYQGRTALVTGASSGIGQAFAYALAERGMSVVLVARRIAVLRSLAEEIHGKYGVRAESIEADLSQPSAVAQMATEVDRRGLSIDLLVNNAGFLTHGQFEKLSPHASMMKSP